MDDLQHPAEMGLSNSFKRLCWGTPASGQLSSPEEQCEAFPSCLPRLVGKIEVAVAPSLAKMHSVLLAQGPTHVGVKHSKRTAGPCATRASRASSHRDSGGRDRDDRLEQTEGGLWLPRQELSMSRRNVLGGSAALTAAGVAAPMVAPQVSNLVRSSPAIFVLKVFVILWPESDRSETVLSV